MPGLFWTDLELCIAQVSAIALDSLANFLLPVGHIGFEMIGQDSHEQLNHEIKHSFGFDVHNLTVMILKITVTRHVQIQITMSTETYETAQLAFVHINTEI